jgi:hypothetical protein
VPQDHFVIACAVAFRHVRHSETFGVQISGTGLQTDIALKPEKGRLGFEGIDLGQAGLQFRAAHLAAFKMHVGDEYEVEAVGLASAIEFEVRSAPLQCRGKGRVKSLAPIAARQRDEDKWPAIISDRQSILAVAIGPNDPAPVGNENARQGLALTRHATSQYRSVLVGPSGG